jgi:hypothetical protein
VKALFAFCFMVFVVPQKGCGKFGVKALDEKTSTP